MNAESMKRLAQPYIQREEQAMQALSGPLRTTAGDLDHLAAEAWCYGSSREERMRRIREAVSPLLRGLEVSDLELLRELYVARLSRASAGVQYHGAMACGGPNSALDQPGGVLKAIEEAH